jgi:hypothetical protein
VHACRKPICVVKATDVAYQEALKQEREVSGVLPEVLEEG